MNKYFYLLLLLFATLLACKEDNLEQIPAESIQNLPDEISHNIFLTYSDSGKTKFTLRAPVIYKFTKDSNYSEFPEGVEAHFFDEDGTEVSNLWAGYAIKRENSDEVIFRDSVRFENSKKEILRSEEVYLIGDSIHSDTTVFIETPQITLEGIGLVAPKDFSSYRLLKPVGTYYTNQVPY